MTISFDDFLKVDIRVGTIVAVEDFPEARRPAYRLRVDFGPELGIRKSSAQLPALYAKEDLLGRQVAAVVNFPPKQEGQYMSECRLLGFPDPEGRVVLIHHEKPVPNRARHYSSERDSEADESRRLILPRPANRHENGRPLRLSAGEARPARRGSHVPVGPKRDAAIRRDRRVGKGRASRAREKRGAEERWSDP